MLHSSRLIQILHTLKYVQKNVLASGIFFTYSLGNFGFNISCKVYAYLKREISATNHEVLDVLVLIALAASAFQSI